MRCVKQVIKLRPNAAKIYKHQKHLFSDHTYDSVAAKGLICVQFSRTATIQIHTQKNTSILVEIIYKSRRLYQA